MTFTVPWKSWLVAAALLVAAVFLWNREHRARTDALRSAEAARLELQNQIVAHEQTRRELQGSISGLLENNASLEAALSEARTAAPDAKPVRAARLDTGPLAVAAKPEAPRVPRAAPAVAKPCALAVEDAVSIEVDTVDLETKAGNTLVVGTASVFRVDPPPKELLASGRFQAPLSRSEALAPPSEPRWGVAALAFCGAPGCAFGGGPMFPPVRVLGARVEAVSGLLVGAGGVWLGGSLGLRF